jgi:hypothetical protein
MKKELKIDEVEMSMALTGRLKVSFDNNFITFDKDNEVHYIKFMGFKSELDEIIEQIKTVLEKHKAEFEKLLWSYENITQLK